MSAALLLLVGAALGPPLQDVRAAGRQGEHAFLELSAQRDACYVHELVAVELRFGLERGFLEQGMIQPFQRRLDVPVQLHATWLAGLPCAQPVAEQDGPRDGASFALEDRIDRARRVEDEVRDGRTFAVFVIERSFHASCTGALTFAAPYLRFAYATRFEQDVFGERVPVDRHDEVVAGRALELEVLPLPDQGRPAGFTGAVGRFAVRAEATPRELAAGQSLKLALTIEGAGDLEHFEPPRLARLEGFRVLGWVEETGPGRRTVVYDLTPLSERVRAVPALEFPCFDPGPPPGYRTLRTEPIPITVRPRVAQQPAEGERVAVGPPDELPSEPGIAGRVVPLLVLALLALAAWLLWRRRRGGAAAMPLDPARARAAAAALRARAAAADVDLAQALAEHLAGRLGCPVPAVIGPGLRARLGAAGVPDARAAEVADLLDELVAARYGGSAPPAALERAAALVEALEAHLPGPPAPG